jgi:hypothetical protein
MLDRREDGYGDSSRPDVLKMDTTDGTWTVAVQNPGKVSYWSTDSEGVVRLGIQTSGEKTGALYRENERAPWRTVLKLEKRPPGFGPVGYEPASDRDERLGQKLRPLQRILGRKRRNSPP